MRCISNIVLSVFCILLPLVSGAQDVHDMLEKIRKEAGTSCVTVVYRFSASVDDVRIEDKGMIEAQDGLWHLKGEALEIYTDARATWILDNSSREAVVEPLWSASDLEQFYSSAAASGNGVDVEIVSFTTSEKKPETYYTPSFSKEWVVTDLR